MWADERVYYPVHAVPYTPARHFAKGKNDPGFRTKLPIGADLAVRARAAGFTFRAVVADSAYGDQDGFRGELAEAGLPFVMALRPHRGTWAARRGRAHPGGRRPGAGLGRAGGSRRLAPGDQDLPGRACRDLVGCRRQPGRMGPGRRPAPGRGHRGSGHPAGQGHLVPGHEPGPARRPARGRQPLAGRGPGRDHADLRASATGSSRATSRSRTSSAGPTSRSAPTSPSAATRCWSTARSASAGRLARHRRRRPRHAPERGHHQGPSGPGHARYPSGTKLAPRAARRPQLADPRDRARALVAGLVQSAPARCSSSPARLGHRRSRPVPLPATLIQRTTANQVELVVHVVTKARFSGRWRPGSRRSGGGGTGSSSACA